ncbi:glycine betaine ABC transporter substrate-binding protein [Pelagibacterium luteolum]|uniref:Glycine betaine/proline transport system substrate-binding protein n=1 Tax=Pelagibacterium luteolum TaxID=440168 RepID=A0A1G7RTA9_9HYPH|nr:glycine betaine ABC transporter substrate-binding protein [Pelagibacterium luteolum]SDG14097.1 glycine betaine/proline transport system substrate-binding protein [Pelagibacterium luteolum]
MRNLARAALIAFGIGLAMPALAQIQVLESPGPDTPEAAEPVSEPEPSAPCGTNEFTIAEMGWPSAAILANIHATLLRAEFECTVRLVPGEPETTLSSIATTRQPAVAPELWVSRQAEVWNGAMRASSARAAAPTFSGGALEAWFVPRYVIENNPGLTSSEDVADHWQVFAPPGTERAELMSCPTEWACAIINQNMAAGLGLTEHFDVVEPLDRFDMDARLSESFARRDPFITYYWQPNALIHRLDLVPLDMGGFDPGSAQCMAIRDCVPFEGSGFAPDSVVIAVAEWVFTDAPDVADYFARASMPLEEMNRLLAWQAEEDASPEAVAQHFLITGQDIWRPWVGEAEAEAEAED